MSPIIIIKISKKDKKNFLNLVEFIKVIFS